MASEAKGQMQAGSVLPVGDRSQLSEHRDSEATALLLQQNPTDSTVGLQAQAVGDGVWRGVSVRV